MDIPIRKQSENSGEKTGIDLIRKQMFAIGNWLCGTLQGIDDDEHDKALAESLDEWISHQVTKYDGLSIGFIQCSECGNTWEALAHTSTANKLECPECGNRETLIVDTPDPLKSDRKLYVPEE